MKPVLPPTPRWRQTCTATWARMPLSFGETGNAPAVYMTADISSEGLMRIYEALGPPVQGDKVAVKLSMGEPDGRNYYFRG